MKKNFSACTVAFDEYEISLKKNYENSIWIQTQQGTSGKCTIKEELTSETVGAALETRPSSLSFHRNILKKIGTQLPTVRIILTRILVGLLRISHLKENFTVNAESPYIFVLYVPTEKEHGGNLPESRQKKA